MAINGLPQTKWRRMSMGQASSSGLFCAAVSNEIIRVTDDFLAGQDGPADLGRLPDVAAYIDDLIIASDTEAQHFEAIRLLLGRLRQRGLRLNARKCLLFRHEIEMLGVRVSGQQIGVPRSRLQAITDMPVPTTAKALHSCIASASYFRRFLPGFAEITADLQAVIDDATRSGTRSRPIPWTPNLVSAFENFRSAFLTMPSLHQPPRSCRRWILRSDASCRAVAAALLYTDEEGAEHLVEAVSQSLTKAQRRYASCEMELWAIVVAAKRWRHLLFDSEVVIKTDSVALKALPTLTHLSPKLHQWGIMILASIGKLTVEWVSAKSPGHQLLDLLSRPAVKAPPPTKDAPVAAKPNDSQHTKQSDQQVADPGKEAASDVGSAQPAELEGCYWIGHVDQSNQGWASALPALHRVLEEQQSDEFCKRLRRQIHDGRDDGHGFHIDERTDLILHRLDTAIPGDHYEFQALIPACLRPAVLQHVHASPLGGGHAAYEICVQRYRCLIYWPGWRADLKTFIHRCLFCDKQNARTRTLRDILLSNLSIKSIEPLRIFHVDFKTMCRGLDGSSTLAIAVDEASRFIIANGLKGRNIAEVASWLGLRVFLPYGAIAILHSDREAALMSKVMQRLMNAFRTTHITSLPYSPWSNSVAESAGVKRLGSQLAKMLEGATPEEARGWSMLLPFALAFLNHTPPAAANTSDGAALISAFEYLHGVPPRPLGTEGWPEVLNHMISREEQRSNVSPEQHRILLRATRTLASLAHNHILKKGTARHNSSAKGTVVEVGSWYWASRTSRRRKRDFPPRLIGPVQAILLAEDNRSAFVRGPGIKEPGRWWNAVKLTPCRAQDIAAGAHVAPSAYIPAIRSIAELMEIGRTIDDDDDPSYSSSEPDDESAEPYPSDRRSSSAPPTGGQGSSCRYNTRYQARLAKARQSKE